MIYNQYNFAIFRITLNLGNFTLIHLFYLYLISYPIVESLSLSDGDYYQQQNWVIRLSIFIDHITATSIWYSYIEKRWIILIPKRSNWNLWLRGHTLTYNVVNTGTWKCSVSDYIAKVKQTTFRLKMKKGKENDCKNLNINFLGARDQAFTQHKEGRFHCEEKCCWSERLFQPSHWRKTSFFLWSLSLRATFSTRVFPVSTRVGKGKKS